MRSQMQNAFLLNIVNIITHTRHDKGGLDMYLFVSWYNRMHFNCNTCLLFCVLVSLSNTIDELVIIIMVLNVLI